MKERKAEGGSEMNPKSDPCYGCTKRCVAKGYNCHSDCPEFAKASAKKKARKDIIRKKKAEEAMVTEVFINSIKRKQKDVNCNKQIAWRK